MRIQILSLAESDLIDGFRFYEEQEPGIGSYFLETLYSDIESLRLYAGVHKQVHGFHRMLSKRFPYGVYYEVAGNDVRIYRVLDCRQDPASIRRKLRHKKGR
jgi:plasmid stabilization system protein ParE